MLYLENHIKFISAEPTIDNVLIPLYNSVIYDDSEYLKQYLEPVKDLPIYRLDELYYNNGKIYKIENYDIVWSFEYDLNKIVKFGSNYAWKLKILSKQQKEQNMRTRKEWFKKKHGAVLYTTEDGELDFLKRFKPFKIPQDVALSISTGYQSVLKRKTLYIYDDVIYTRINLFKTFKGRYYDEYEHRDFHLNEFILIRQYLNKLNENEYSKDIKLKIRFKSYEHFDVEKLFNIELRKYKLKRLIYEI